MIRAHREKLTLLCIYFFWKLEAKKHRKVRCFFNFRDGELRTIYLPSTEKTNNTLPSCPCLLSPPPMPPAFIIPP